MTINNTLGAAGHPMGEWAVAKPVAGRAEKWLQTVADTVGALLTAAEVLILFIGIVARYVFHAPLTWTDELASILFLWLVMFGAVSALCRNQHMRMSLFVDTASPPVKAFLEALAIVAMAVLLGCSLWPAIDYAIHEGAVVTSSLEVPVTWRAAAIAVGFGMMGLVCVARLSNGRERFRNSLALALVVLIGGGLWLASPVLRPLGNYQLLIYFVALPIGAVLAGVPIAVAFGLSTFAYLALVAQVPMTVFVSRMDEGMSHLILLSVPLFVFLGALIEATGMAKAMVGFLASLLGHVKGGLSYVLLAAMYLVSGISGSKAADMAAVAPVLFPEMKKRGARPGELVALLSSSGAMSETIPPSLVLITIGSVTGVSIAALFAGGLLPALVLALALCAIVWYRSRSDDLSGVQRSTKREIFKLLLIALPGIALPFIIRSAVIEGVSTATEVSTIGIAYTLMLGVILKGGDLSWTRLRRILTETATLSGNILFIIGAATAMAWALTRSGFSRDLVQLMANIPGGAAGFLAISVVAFIVLGSILEGIPAIVLFGPLLFPVARSMGINEVHYSMVVVLAMGIGLFAPPFGVGYYAACAIGKVNPSEGIRPIWLYMAAMLVGLVLVTVFPSISTVFLK